MKKHLSSILLVVIILAGLSLLLYPSFSNYWNERHQSVAIQSYGEQVAQMDNSAAQQLLQQARAYNRTLMDRENRFVLNDAEAAQYEGLLDVTGTGIMGYVEIPSLDCMLPIYHGTDEAVLQIAVGHIAGSSLPVGGEGTHCVISGHRGLPSAKLFTNLDQLAEGDVFRLHVLDEILSYEVDQILTVEPQDVAALEIDPEQDLCTLVTCTPYGINSHRLLVRGHRVETVEERAPVRVSSDAAYLNRNAVALCLAAPVLVVLLLVAVLKQPRKRSK
ncbi:MAG: class C sortase [Aristaeellaceae bacterium]